MGKVLAGRYELLKQIAVGGMATVHLARALGVGGFERLVAIKVMHAHIGAEPDFVTMFLDEARLAARIRHPNVVPTLDVQESADGLFLVMEYIEGPSLHQLIKATSAGKTAGNGIPLAVTLRLTIDALSGLHDAHELTDDDGHPLSLVHRDVSPANVLVGTDGVARITDFGVARAEARLSSTRGGQLKGKIPYMPPEQLMSEQIDRRCDVYAAGAMLWETLVGRRLFQADSDGALLQKILAGPEGSPRQINPHIPASIDAVCMQALARDKNARFATAADFADALERAAQASGIAIASARAVASFVDQSGAYRKLTAKEIAALKSGVAVDTPAARASGAGQPISRPAVDAQDQPKSTPTAPSQVTSHGSALSARFEAPKPRRTGLYAAAVGMLIAGAAAAIVFRPKDEPAPATSQAAPAPSAARSTSEMPSAAATVEPRPTAVESLASGASSASAAPPVAPSAAVKGRLPIVKDTKPVPDKVKPPPTSYSPDRL
ncbi:MAG: protein kinase [Myxococcales bacterium]|nr:protein kinase [Myxococcales bacterium]